MIHFVAPQRPARLDRLSLIVAAILAGVPAVSLAQAPTTVAPTTVASATKPVIKRGGSMPLPNVRNAPNLTPAQITQVKTWVKTEAEAMAAGDASVLSSARNNLITASTVGDPTNPNKPPVPASPAYQTAFASALDAALVPQLGSKDARIRLNAAVTLAKVAAGMSQGTTLAASTKLALADGSEAVAIWGARAAKDVYPNLLAVNQPEAKAVSAALIAAAGKHPTSAAIAESAYAALAGTAVTSNPQKAGAGLDAMIALMQARAQAYAKVDPTALPEQDPSFPARPELDAPVGTYLAISGWKAMNPAQKAAAGRALFDQTSEIVRIGPLLPAGAPGGAQVRLAEMMKELRNMTGVLQVIFKSEGSTNGAAAAVALSRMATNSPAQPLMQAEVEKIKTAMTDAKILAAPPATPGSAAAPSALNK